MTWRRGKITPWLIASTLVGLAFMASGACCLWLWGVVIGRELFDWLGSRSPLTQKAILFLFLTAALYCLWHIMPEDWHEEEEPDGTQ